MYSPWFALAVTVAILGLVSTPLFLAADQPPADGPHRVSAIDGLRGFAAFGVFLHHAVITHDFIARGVWQLPPSRFFSMVGQVGVSVFFLITGYLFWSKLLREHGRPNWVALYLGRVFRIGPVYTLMFFLVLVFVAVASRGRLSEETSQIAGELANWLSLGMFSAVPINGDMHTGIYVAGVTWSLQYEWAFYAGLFVLSVGARRERWAIPFTTTLGIGSAVWWLNRGPYWLSVADPIFALLFVGGMACASLEARAIPVQLPKWLLSLGCLALTVATFVLFPVAYALLPTLMLSLAFYLVLSGGDLFGLLCCRGARRLGDISFGIYLLQGLVLTVAFHSQTLRSYALASKTIYWSVVLVAAVALVALATAAHHWLERPGIQGGRAFIHLFAARERGPTSGANR